mgnify:CR=1 FL=1
MKKIISITLLVIFILSLSSCKPAESFTYQDVLNKTATFITKDNKKASLENFELELNGKKWKLEPRSYLITDLDGDKNDEMIITEKENKFKLVLHTQRGRIYGHVIRAKQMLSIKADGSFKYIDDTVNGDRIIYNCIASNCYYVLRVAAPTTSYPNMDARNPENRNWSFYSSNEKDIYNKWYPADVSAKGVYSDTAEIVPDASLGGGYFLIWNDYAALNTQTEVWNGVKDNTGTSNYFYSLFDRMWSNIIKMWNSDINKTVTFNDFTEIRDTFGWFPGFTNCNTDAVLPSAGKFSQAYTPDFTVLENALAEKITNETGLYSEESFAAYENAYNNALLVREDMWATQTEINTAAENILTAKNNLVLQIYIDAEIKNIEKITDITPLGRKAGLIVTTAKEAVTIDISLDGTPVQADEIISEVQPRDGKEVKIWYLNFTPEEKGTYDYTITVNELVSENFEIIVK